MRQIIGVFLLVACCFAGNSALAHTPKALEVQAVVQTIDYQKEVLTLAYVQGGGPKKLVWNADTEFLRDLKPVPASELKEGVQVTVYYHSPFFGRPYITKIVWAGKG